MSIEMRIEILEEKMTMALLMGHEDIADFYRQEINRLEKN